MFLCSNTEVQKNKLIPRNNNNFLNKAYENENIEAKIEVLRKNIVQLNELCDKDYFENVFNISVIPRILRKLKNKDLSIIVVDIDGLKDINDISQSHSAGRNALKIVSEVMNKNLKDLNHIIFRPSAPFFIALTSNEDRKKINEVVNRIRDGVRSIDYTLNGNKYDLTVSQGICCARFSNPTVNDISKMFYSAFMSIKERKNLGEKNIIVEHNGKLIMPDSYSHERLFPYKMLDSIHKESKIISELSKFNNLSREKYLEKLKEFKNLRLEMAKDEVAMVYKRCFLFNNPEKNDVMKRSLSKSQNMPLSVMMIDIDHMHELTDKYGAQIGNKVIQKVGKKVIRNCGINYLAYLYGGDEIVVIAPNTTKTRIERIAENVRHDVSRIILEEDGTRPVTISVGTTTRMCKSRDIKQYYEEIDSMLDEADKGLYFSKNNGKNRIMSYNELGGKFKKTEDIFKGVERS